MAGQERGRGQGAWPGRGRGRAGASLQGAPGDSWLPPPSRQLLAATPDQTGFLRLTHLPRDSVEGATLMSAVLVKMR